MARALLQLCRAEGDVGDPRKHHYIPVCYLKQWAKTEDKRLCEHKLIPDIGVKPRRTAPAGTGYAPDLYRVDGVPEAVAHDLETKFMHLVDTYAAQSIERIVAGQTDNWTGDLRSAWTRFIVWLVFRNPEAFSTLTEHVVAMWEKGVEALEPIYAKEKRPEEPPTLKEYYEQGGAPRIDAARFLAELIDDGKIGTKIFGMRWGRIDLSKSSVQLLTSDRPLDMPLGLDDPDAYIAIAVAPKVLFVAANKQAVIDGFRAQDPTKLAKEMNTRVIRQARKFVWGANDAQLTYIQRNLGKLPDRVIVTDEQKQAAINAIPEGEEARGLLV